MQRSHYRNRADAGRVLLAALLEELPDDREACPLVVLGLARGGVPVAAEVARGLGAPLDVAVVRKLGVPGHEELALGAITVRRMVLNHRLVEALSIGDDAIDDVVAQERVELARREAAYRGGRAPITLHGRTAILVDDGIATGASMRAVALDAREQGATRVIVAVPTAPRSAAAEFDDVADDFVCTYMPESFVAVGMSYRDFGQTSDEEVRELLAGD